MVEVSNLIKEIIGVEFNALSLYELKFTNVEQLITLGLTETRASKLIASIELGKQVTQYKLSKIDRIDSTNDAQNYFADIRDFQQEVLKVAFLNAKNQVIKSETIFRGTVNSSIAHPREIFKEAVKYPTVYIIMAHNHPSGNTEPSAADIAFTKRMISCGEMMGIEILDHIIVGDSNCLSLREETDIFK